jgi:phosphatidylserine/phosphatidylglycerophosphate/cardiolipin synthase-like enzyme
MIPALLDLAPNLRARLSSALATRLLAPPYPDAVLRAHVDRNLDVVAVRSALEALDRRGVHGPAQAALLDSLDDLTRAQSRPDLVWTGAPITGLEGRRTRVVFEELLGNAERSLWISSYVVYDGASSFEALARRMDARPELEVHLLLNVARPYKDDSSNDELIHRFAHDLWTKGWPGTRRPRVYYDPRALEDGPQRSVLHAKAVVADEEHLFVTSANLTEAAWDRNIELGVLLRDRALAGAVVRNLRGLVDRGLLHALP